MACNAISQHKSLCGSQNLRSSTTLTDAYGRPLNNLRIAVTNECNYRCFFCHIEGDPVGSPRPIGAGLTLMKPHDYFVVALGASRLGISSFKLTGGEPLLRSDIVDVVSSIREGAGKRADLSMTTNGYLLARLAQRLAAAGLNRVNVSLHSLNREHYRAITGVDGLDHVLDGLRESAKAGLKVKVNVTVTRINVNDVWDVIMFASEMGFKVQLIELQPVNLGMKVFSNQHVPLDQIEERLLAMGAKRRTRDLHNRPLYVLPDGTEVEVVKPFNNPLFCAGCTRVRLLADGTLIPCINYRGIGVNLLRRIRGLGEEEAVEEVVRALIEVNSLRRPYYLWRLDLRDGAKSVRGLRLSIPSRAMAQAGETL
ncbi:MAG: GTP 3',8-cyclase MoaA [Acidilobus sp.]